MEKELSLYIHLNSKCNLACHYCYVKKQENNKINLKKIKENLSYFLNKNSFLFITFTGGEPLLSFKELQELVSFIKEKQSEVGFDYEISLITNGTLFNNEILNYLLQENLNIILSLDGQRETNDKNRKFKNNNKSVFDQVTQHLKNFNDFSIFPKIFISKVVSPNNLNSLTKDILFFNKMGFKAVDLGIENYKFWSDHEIKECLRFFKNLMQDYFGLFVDNKNKKIIKITNLESLINNENHRLLNCEKYRINYDGNVFLCQSCLFNKSLFEKYKLNKTDNIEINKADFLQRKIKQLNNKINLNNVPFCPIDLYIYCQDNNLNFMRFYSSQVKLRYSFNKILFNYFKKLKNNTIFKKLYNLD